MLIEDYCNFEIAKLLKEKGFNEPCTHYYPNEKSLVDLGYSQYHHTQNHELLDEYAAPTLQMAMKWLREVHKCFIEIKEYFDIKQYQAFVSKYGKTTYCEPDWFHPICNSYEEACEAAIKYCLENLI